MCDKNRSITQDTAMETETFLLHIREAQPKDAAELQQLLHTTWLATYPNRRHGITRADIEHHFKERLTDAGIQKCAEDLATYETKRMILLGFDHGTGTMVGMCRALKAVLRDEHNKLCALYVLPGYQGCGVGRAMWDYVYKKHLNPYSCTITHATAYNTRAIRFYTKKLGFVRTDSPTLRDPRWQMQSGHTIPDIELCLKAQPAP